MKIGWALLSVVACSRSTPAPAPSSSASTAAALPAASASGSATPAPAKHPDAPPQEVCEGANVDIGWAMRGKACKAPSARADAGANDLSPLQVFVEPTFVSASAVKTTKLDVWIHNPSHAPVVLDVARTEPRVMTLNAKGQTPTEAMLERAGVIGLLNSGGALDVAHVTIAADGWGYVKASLDDVDPEHPGELFSDLGGKKRDAGAASPLPPGKYRVALSFLRKLPVADMLEVR